MENNFKGFPLHNEVDNNMQRSFNRLNTALNINDALGENEAGLYFEEFDQKARLEIVLMAKYIKEQGRDAVIKKINELYGEEGCKS